MHKGRRGHMYLRGGSLPRDNRRRTDVRVWLVALIALGIAAASLSGAHGPPAASAASGAAAPVDVEIAIDGTESMATAVAQAKTQGAQALSNLAALLPDTRFGIVVFRDHGNPAGEYQLLQPLTSDVGQADAALNRVTTHFNPSPNNGLAESYNLAFEQSYSDARMGWRPSARKIVVVLGDAEPNAAGTDGMPGCKDHSRDPEGLSTPHVLANMRANQLTLIMIRELSSEVSASLQCYQSIAAGAYVGGEARNANADIAAMIVEEIIGAYAPVTVKSDLGVALRNDRTGYMITVQNPNALPLQIKSLAFVLPPSGFRYVRSSITSPRPVQSGLSLSWALNTPVGPNQKARFHVVVRTPHRTGRYAGSATAQFETARGNELNSRRPVALVNVKRRIHSVRLIFSRKTAARTTLTGRVAVRFGKWKGLPALGLANGRLILRSGTKRVVMRVAGVRLDSLDVPTRARLRVRITGSAGYGSCRPGGRGTLVVVDSSTIRQDGRTTALVLSLPPGCSRRIVPTATMGFFVN